jgi:hypothetical protein
MNKVMDFLKDHPVISAAVAAYVVGSMVGFLFRGQFC